MKKKKIIQTAYSGLSGAGSVVFSIIEADKENQVDWVLIFYGIEDLLEEYRLKCEALKVSYFFLKKEKVGAIDFAGYHKIYKFIDKEKPDAIFSNMSSLIFICKWHKRKHPNCQLISIEHHSVALIGKKYWWLINYVIKWSDCLVYLTPNYRQEMLKRVGQKLKGKKIAVIPNGINVEYYKPNLSNNKVSLNDSQRPIYLGMMCRLSATKDIPTIFEALSLLKNKSYYSRLTFLLAGDGEKRNEWETLAKTLKLEERVSFLGMLDEAGLLQFLNKLNIYIQSTSGETMSISIMQAQAMGLPVLASDVSGVGEFVFHKETGLLFEFQNAQALAETIDSLFKDELLQESIGAKARNFAVQHYSNITMLDQYLALTE